MAAKMKSKKEGRRKTHSRSDWAKVEIEIMDWVLRIKLAQHYDRFAALLRRDGREFDCRESRKDRFWGAVEEQNGILRGQNQLGRLLMDLCELVEAKSQEERSEVSLLNVPDFSLFGNPIGSYGRENEISSSRSTAGLGFARIGPVASR